MAEFISWQVEYARAKNALATRSWDSYVLQSIENQQQMRTSYALLANVTAFIEWLGVKASEEAAGVVEGSIPMCIGGY